MSGYGTQLKPDGSFEFNNVAAGEYRISVQYSPSDDNVGFPAGSASGSEYASVAVTVAGRDITGLSLITATGGSARGRITFDGGTPRTASPAALTVSAVPMSASLTMMMTGGSARPNQEGRYSVQ